MMAKQLTRTLICLAVISTWACAGAQSKPDRGIADQQHKYPITVHGADEASFTPPANGPVSNIDTDYDAIVVGAGLGGLSATVYLSDNPYNKKVLLLEKEPHVGGLAAWGTTPDGNLYGRGGAYWTDPFPEEMTILRHIGLGNYLKTDPIPEPIDAFYWNDHLYSGLWSKQTLAEMPASFALFHYELKKENDEGYIPDQPLEEAAHPDLDKLNTAQWIRSMPARVKARKDAVSKRVYARFAAQLADGTLNPNDPMDGVIGLMDLYCRSALGSVSADVSALAFANFYISEIVTRYSTNRGTGGATEQMARMLDARKDRVTLLTSATVTRIVNTADGVQVEYVKDGQAFRAHAKYAVFSAQLKFAPQLIEGLATADPEKASVISRMRYAHYSVHVVQVKGHPYRNAYDTWLKPSDATLNDPTDVILGRWMDPNIMGYGGGMRDFTKDPPDSEGLFTIYHPLPPDWVGSGYTTQQAADVAEKAVDRMIELIGPLARRLGPVEGENRAQLDPSVVTSVDTSRWPYSIDIVAPGHFIHDAPILRRPVGHVFFANNNIGTPAFEEALFRGRCAAINILSRSVPGYKIVRPKSDDDKKTPDATRCPIEP